MKSFACLILAIVSNLNLGAQTPYLIKDIFENGSSMPVFMGSVNGKVIFTATNLQYGRELWASDGTDQGTVMIKDFIPGISGGLQFNVFFVSDTLIFFFGKQNNNNAPLSLFATNGTSTGTVWLCDIADITPPMLSGINGKCLFVNKLQNGRELWVSDGTASGTKMLKDINTSGAGAEPFNLTPCGNQLFFIADDSDHGQELWVTDGTESGTRLVKDIFSGIVSSTYTTGLKPGIIAMQDKVYFCAIEDTKTGYELYVSDGTDTGTKLVKDLLQGDYKNSIPYVFGACDKFIIMYATNEHGRNSVWISDGTAEGTEQIIDDSAGNLIQNTSLKHLNLGDKLIFQFTSKEFGSELWVSDGTISGTHILIDATPGIASGVDGTMFRLGNQFIFTASNPFFGKELWISDGTQDNTHLFADLLPGANGSGLYSLMLHENTLYCNLSIDPNIQAEPYKIDLNTSNNIEPILAYIERIFPNPCTSCNSIYVPSQFLFYRLYNSVGQLIESGEVNNHSVPLDDALQSGPYILELSNHETTTREKIIISR